MNMDFLTDSILAEFGRSDFIGGIDNEALDFGHLEQFIHSSAASTADTSPSVVSVDDDNNTHTQNSSTTNRNDQHQQQISTVESNDNHHQQQTNINNITTVNNRINNNSNVIGTQTVTSRNNRINSSSGIINISTSTPAQPQQTIKNSSVNSVTVAAAAVTQTHLPESPPDSGSEPPYSPRDLHGLTLTSQSQQQQHIIIQQPHLPESPPDSGSEPPYSPRDLHGLTLTSQQHIIVQQPPPSTPVLQNNNELTAISDGSISMNNINEITQHHNQQQQLHILSQHHQQQQQLNHQLHNSHFISEQHQPQLHSILCNNHTVNSNGLFIRSNVCSVGGGGVGVVDVINNDTVHNLQQQHVSHHHSQTITIRKPDDILLATTTTVIGNGITASELQMQHNHQQQHLSTTSTRTLGLESNYHHPNQNGLLSTATDNNLMGLVQISPISGNTGGPISTIPNNSIVVVRDTDGNSNSVNDDVTENEDLSRLIPNIYTSNDLRNHQSQQTLQNVGLLSTTSTGPHQQSITSTDDLDNNLSENRTSTINMRKRKLSHTDNSSSNKISQITDSMQHIISVVKPEPDTSLSPVCNHQNIKPPLSPSSPNLSTTIPSNLSMPSDQSSLDGSVQQNSDSTSEQCPLQCIRFSPFQQQSWHILCNQNLQELPIPHYRVDADKGFNFSNSDDAFVCQKKNHFQITCHVQLQGTAIFVRTPTGLEKIKSFHLHFYGVKLESPNQMIRVEQSQSDRSKKPFHPVPIDLKNRLLSKVTVGRLHFSETTSNNMRKKGRPNPEQRYFQLVVGLHAHTHTGHFPIISQGSERIIVRASNPGQFESDIELCWQRGITQDSIFHAGRVGINTDRPDESLVIHGNIKLSGHIVQPSDSRAKREIMELDTAVQLKNMQKIRVVRYCYEPEFAIHSGLKKPKFIYGNNNNLDYNLNDDDDDDQIIDTGVIAQEVREILPDAVTEAGSIVLPSGQVIENFLLVNKDRILMENIGAVKELCKVTGSLETRIEQLEKINSRLLHIQQLDRNHNCIKNKNKCKKLSKLDDDEYTSGKCNGEICSNTTIQMIIIILVIIMAICLAAISTLYFIERAKKSYSSKPYIYNSRQNQIDNNFNHKYQYSRSTLQPLLQQQSSSHQFIPTSISYLSTPAGNGVNGNDEIIQNINNNNNSSISSSINSSDIIDLSNYKIKNTNTTKLPAPLPPPPLPPLQTQQQSISKHIQLDNKKIINKSNSSKINIIIKTNNINDNYNNNNHNNNNHHRNNITSSEKISVVTVDILEPQDVENNSIDTDVQQQQQQKQHEKELHQNHHHNDQLSNNQQQQKQTSIILKVVNSDTNNNGNIDDIITKNVKPSLAKTINNNNIQSITTTTTTMSSSSTYHNTIDNVTVTSEQLNNINDLILITNNNYNSKHNNTNLNNNQNNNNHNIKNDSDQQDLQDLNNNSESEDQIDISSQLTQTKNKFILSPIIGTPNNCLKNNYKLDTLKIINDPSDASNINSNLNCIDSSSIIIINECQSICCKNNNNNLSLDNHNQQNNYDNIDIINNNDNSKSVTVTSNIDIEHIIDPKNEINVGSTSSIILLKNEQKYNNNSNNNNNKNYNKKNNNHHNKSNNNNSKILNNDKEYDFIDDNLKIFTKLQQDPVKKINRSKTDLLITSNFSNKHNNTNNNINNNNKNNNNPDYDKQLTNNNDKQLTDDCSSIVPWIRTESINNSLEAVTVCFNSGYNLNITYAIPISKYMHETKLEIHFIGSSKLHWTICNDQERSNKMIEKTSGETSYSSSTDVISGGGSVILTDDDDTIDDKDNKKQVLDTQKSIIIDEAINSSINNFNKYENNNNNNDNDDNSTINRIYQRNSNKAIFYLNLPNYGYFNRRIEIIATPETDKFGEKKNKCMTNNYDQTDDLTNILRYNLNIYRNCD